jgi:hypothetical protein
MGLVWALPPDRRWRMLWVAMAVGAAAWLPFVVAEPSTLGAMRPTLATSPASIIHLFGVGLDYQPVWVRPVQLFGSLVAGSLAVWRGRWAAVLAVGIAVRLALDPGVFLYYSAGMVLGAIVWDLIRSRWPVPLWTFISFWSVAVVREDVLDPTVQATLRLLLIALLLAAVLFTPGHDQPCRLDLAPDAKKPGS